MNKRMLILSNLINFDKPLNEIKLELRELEWDYNGKEYVVTIKEVINVINKYKTNKISAFELEEWANLIECREDIKFEEKNFNKLNNIIYTLANPVLEGEISKVRIKKLSSGL